MVLETEERSFADSKLSSRILKGRRAMMAMAVARKRKSREEGGGSQEEE